MAFFISFMVMYFFVLRVCVFVCVHLIAHNRVASVQSEPGQQNLLIQPPLGRKRGLRQVWTSPFVCLKALLNKKKKKYYLSIETIGIDYTL